MQLYYWRGKGFWAWLVRLATSSQWSHVAVAVEVLGERCYFESYPFKGVRLMPESLRPPDAIQDAGVEWTRWSIFSAMRDLGKPYDFLDGVLAVLGISPRCRGLECAELALRILAKAGRRVDAPATPQGVWDAIPGRGSGWRGDRKAPSTGGLETSISEDAPDQIQRRPPRRPLPVGPAADRGRVGVEGIGEGLNAPQLVGQRAPGLG